MFQFKEACCTQLEDHIKQYVYQAVHITLRAGSTQHQTVFQGTKQEMQGKKAPTSSEIGPSTTPLNAALLPFLLHSSSDFMVPLRRWLMASRRATCARADSTSEEISCTRVLALSVRRSAAICLSSMAISFLCTVRRKSPATNAACTNTCDPQGALGRAR